MIFYGRLVSYVDTICYGKEYKDVDSNEIGRNSIVFLPIFATLAEVWEEKRTTIKNAGTVLSWSKIMDEFSTL